MANPQKLNEWFINGKGYRFDCTETSTGEVVLGLENTSGHYSYGKMHKEELITVLRDLANQVEGWLMQERTDKMFAENKVVVLDDPSEDPDYDWAADDFHNECGDR